ncbi:hypothetical protein ANCCEY_07844 [Ancylostoma ceylanicum]|uniref:Uncharacterized protein n=2 Tax=Ancylostoma ceylanicum TaxID=53326 RepID=A0A0D6LLW0_9BILA|nr:hypothetical protein ANCCEY_07844 [Ancylostoma ceylanicum]EYC32907.1 hypothetical protein Y032_0002g504 [Ancylostoma ceylanicum]
MKYQAIASIGNDLFAVREESDSLQPMLVQMDTNDIGNIVHKVAATLLVSPMLNSGFTQGLNDISSPPPNTTLKKLKR